MRRSLTLLSCLALGAAVGGCGWTVTNDYPSCSELGPEEREAVDDVLAELKSFNRQVVKLTRYNIDNIIDCAKINVTYEGVLFVSNLGDDRMHMAVWENLDDSQKDLVMEWFGTRSSEVAARWYRKFFYQFLGTTQGVKQYMFNVLTPEWVFAHRSVFNIERDSIRNALVHYATVGRKNEMWPFLTERCKPIIKKYARDYPNTFPNIKKAKAYMKANITDMANPDNPTGYMYFICEWVNLGKVYLPDQKAELDWLRDLPLP